MKSELKPKFEDCVSYWKRAYVSSASTTGAIYLVSYGKYVCFVDVRGVFHRKWDGWSRTSGRHIVEFWRQFCGKGPVPYKKVWDAMPVEIDSKSAENAVHDLMTLEAKP